MNCTTLTQDLQGATTILSKQDICDTKELAFEMASSLSPKKLLTYMGILNGYTWRAATDYRVFYRESGENRVDIKNWNNLLVCSAKGEVEMTVSVECTGKYLKKQWPGAFHTDVTIRNYREQLRLLGLFWYDIENRPKGAMWGARNGVPAQGVATPPLLERVDIARMLIFYQVFDQVRRAKINKKLKLSEDVTAFDCMPEHGGMMMVELYNLLFFGLSDFRGNYYRDGGITVGTAESVPPVNCYQWKWNYNPAKHLFRSAWKRMIDRVGFVAERALEVVTEVVVEVNTYGDMADVPY